MKLSMLLKSGQKKKHDKKRPRIRRVISKKLFKILFLYNSRRLKLKLSSVSSLLKNDFKSKI